MHVAVLGAVVYGLCYLLLLRPRIVATVGLIAVILYGAVALPSPPVVRSVLLCASFALGIMSRRSTDGIQLLAVSVLAMLVYQPLDLYNAGFQLSFGTVLGLALTHRVTPLLVDPHAEVALSAARQSRPSWSLIWRHRLRRWLMVALVPAIIAWLVSLPLVAYHFEQLNPWAIAASILLAPIVLLALIGGSSSFFSRVCHVRAEWASLAPRPSHERHPVGALAMLPGSYVRCCAINSSILLYYVILCLTLVKVGRPSSNDRLSAPICAVALSRLSPGSAPPARSPAAGRALTMPKSAAGQCCVSSCRRARSCSTTATSRSPPVRKCIGPCLRDIAGARASGICSSHGDSITPRPSS